MKPRSNDGRGRLFLWLCSGCVLAIVLFGIFAARRSRTQTAAQPQVITPEATAGTPATLPSEPSTTTNSLPTVAVSNQPAKKTIYFRANALGPNYGKVAVATLDEPEQIRYAPKVSCDRLYFAAGNGVCLASDRGVFTSYSAVMFDEQLQPGWSITLSGIPSRVRISPGGKLAAITVFVSGHSYAGTDFSTQTLIVDVHAGKVLADLEQFSVRRDNAEFQSPDFNFWGVTFLHDENRFYATLSSKGKTYLVECDLMKRSAKVIYEGVECPSVSPDNSRVAFKKRTGPISWRISVLDLKTLTETPLNEPRSVDDQVEWLDNDHVLYALSENPDGSSASTDIWSLPARRDGMPRILLKGAESPAVITNRLQ
jgi:hypothetical protein